MLINLEKKTGPLSQTLLHEQEQTYAVARATAGPPVQQESGFSRISEEPPVAQPPRPVRGNHLYALGGFQGEILSSVETYSPQMNAWVPLAPMDSVRNFPAGVAHPASGLLYVCGGFDGRALSASVEAYDPSTGRWAYVPSMSKGRYGLL